MSVETRYKVLLWVTKLVYCLKCHAIDNCQKFGSFSPCGPHNTFKKFTAAKSWNVGFFCPLWQKILKFSPRTYEGSKRSENCGEVCDSPPPHLLFFTLVPQDSHYVCWCVHLPTRASQNGLNFNHTVPSITDTRAPSLCSVAGGTLLLCVRKTWLTNCHQCWYFTSFWEKVVFIGVVLYPLFSSNVGWTSATVTLWCGHEIKRKATLNKMIWKNVNLP